MVQISKNLFIGNDADCVPTSKSKSFAVVHACKSCHSYILNYKGSLDKDDSNYLIFENGNHLFLNLVDMNQIYPEYTDPIFKKAYDFIESKIGENRVLIHCNEGRSRSCSLAIFYLAKKKIIPDNSLEEALKSFSIKYPDVMLGEGFYNYLKDNWVRLVK